MICVDARMIDSSGIGTYTRELVLRMKNHYRLVLLVDRKLASKYSNWENTSLIYTAAPIYSIEEQIALPFLIPSCDLFWSPHFNVPLGPIRAKHRLVTVHDVFFLKFAKELSIHKQFYAKIFFNAALKFSDHIITDSQFSLSEICKYLGPYHQKITAIPLGVDYKSFEELSGNIRNELSIPSKYILYVGNLAPHKNISALLKSLDFLPDDIHLVIVGKETKWKGWKPEWEKRKSRVTICGHVDDATLVWLYQNAAMLIHPSYYEGFGLTPLEAMSAGCPVVVSKAASLPEVCGDAVVYVDPFDIKSIAEGILSVWNQPMLQSELKRKGKERAKIFDWDVTAQKHREVIDKILD